MMRKFLLLVSLLISLLATGMPSDAWAQPVSKQQAASIAKSKFQGRVIAVDEGRQDNVKVYRVKVLDKQGGLHTVIIDHQTGDIIAAH
jgi:uncharacterized membrane protein YkoI